MANRNDFKLLHAKCIQIYENVLATLKINKDSLCNLTDTEKARYGFYYLILQTLTDGNEIEEFTDMICDTEFNSRLFDNRESDEGIDAAYFDNEHNQIVLFSFKYREKFSVDKEQNINELISASKFFNAINTGNTQHLKGKIKTVADDINTRLDSNQIWTIIIYYATNENITLTSDHPNVKSFAEEYDIEFKGFGLNEIVEATSIRPRNIDASFCVKKGAALTYEEDEMSSNKSYIVKMSLPELIRITCNDPILRNDANKEGDESLIKAHVDLNVLFDNVRGFILRSKFNDNIVKSLYDEPQRFFYYNNGITIIANDIKSTESRIGGKWNFIVSDFQVVNGGQTLRSIHKFNQSDENNMINKLTKAHILVRFLRISDNNLRNKIGEFTNSQNAISLSDLRSLRSEQIQLEQFLDAHGIQYFRKKGDFKASKSYKYSIGKERLGQLLLSTMFGRPEIATNKKREIFDSLYDELFISNDKLLSEETLNLIFNFQDIESSYRKSEFSGSIQKNMYIAYLKYKLGDNTITSIISKFETFLKRYIKENPKDQSASRFLITTGFKESLDKEFKIN
ncbi:AIPR family protein [Bacteroides acidifaciens]|nr:AIPR family protein [Bacteroides acidifaciens]